MFIGCVLHTEKIRCLEYLAAAFPADLNSLELTREWKFVKDVALMWNFYEIESEFEKGL